MIEVKEANSKKLSYVKPVVLYQSSKTKVTAIPFFIDRSSGKDVTLKIQTKKKENHLLIGLSLKKNQLV